MNHICDECQQTTTKVFRVKAGELCERCVSEWNAKNSLKPAESKTHKPAKSNQNDPFTRLPSYNELFNSGRRSIDADTIAYLRKLPLETLQEEITGAVAVLTAASMIYGDKVIAESLKQKEELLRQQKELVRKWRDKQCECEKEKKARSLRGTDRKFYAKTGRFLNEAIVELKSEFDEWLKFKIEEESK
jgi:hypothetical protein